MRSPSDARARLIGPTEKLGMTPLLQDGVAKAIAGQTDMKQVLAVCSK